MGDPQSLEKLMSEIEEEMDDKTLQEWKERKVREHMREKPYDHGVLHSYSMKRGIEAGEPVFKIIGMIEALDAIGRGLWSLDLVMLSRHRDALHERLSDLMKGDVADV